MPNDYHFMTAEQADVDTNDLAAYARSRAKELGYLEDSETTDEHVQSTEEAFAETEEVEEVQNQELQEKQTDPEPKTETESVSSLSAQHLRLTRERSLFESERKAFEEAKTQFEAQKASLETKVGNLEEVQARLLSDPISQLKAAGFDQWEQLIRDSYNEYLGDDADANYKTQRRLRQAETEMERRARIAEEKADAALQALQTMEARQKYNEYLTSVRQELDNIDPNTFENVNTVIGSQGAEFVRANVVKIADWYADNYKQIITPFQALEIYERELGKLIGKKAPQVATKAPEPVVDDVPGNSNNLGSTRGSKTAVDEFDLNEARKRAAAALFSESE